MFRSDGTVLDHEEDIYSLSRVYGRRKRVGKVIANFEVLERSRLKPLNDEIVWYHSLAYKRQRDWPRAVELWQQLIDSSGPEAFYAALELAMYFEHQVGDISNALDFSLRAKRAGSPNSRQSRLLEKRLSRLEGKLKLDQRR